MGVIFGAEVKVMRSVKIPPAARDKHRITHNHSYRVIPSDIDMGTVPLDSNN